jgi:hypothetical protein
MYRLASLRVLKARGPFARSKQLMWIVAKGGIRRGSLPCGVARYRGREGTS